MYGYFAERNYKGDYPYTDLALERRRVDTDLPGVDFSTENLRYGSWERMKIATKSAAESIGRQVGVYNTLNTDKMDMLYGMALDEAKDQLAKELCSIFDDMDIFPGRILVAGLGNILLTPDAIGCEVAAKVKPTLQIAEADREFFESLSCAEIAICTPGVCATSGLDAAIVIKGICDMIKPDAVIAIDALASRDPIRLGRTIQVCNTGISPGSGLGNTRLSISIETVGVPVIAIGVPTVIDSRLLCPDFCASSDKNINEAMFVSPKEINEIISVGAEIIAEAINQAFGVFT